LETEEGAGLKIFKNAFEYLQEKIDPIFELTIFRNKYAVPGFLNLMNGARCTLGALDGKALPLNGAASIAYPCRRRSVKVGLSCFKKIRSKVITIITIYGGQLFHIAIFSFPSCLIPLIIYPSKDNRQETIF